MEHFDAPCFSALDLHGFIKEMNRITLETCGCRISEDMSVYVEKFAHGGMSDISADSGLQMEFRFYAADCVSLDWME